MSSPLATVDFIDNYESIVRRRYAPPPNTQRMTLAGRRTTMLILASCVCVSTDVLSGYEWLVCYLLLQSFRKIERLRSTGKVCLPTVCTCCDGVPLGDVLGEGGLSSVPLSHSSTSIH